MIHSGDLTEHADILLLEAQRAAQRGDWANALALADEVLKGDPSRAEAMYLVGQALRKTGNEGAALTVLTFASKIEPKRPAIWLAMAQCMQERLPQEAYEAAQRALALNPGPMEGDAMSLLCNVSSVLGRNEEALDWAAKYEAKYGIAGEVCHNKSFALFALGRWKEAWREFKPSLGMENRRRRNYHAGQETPRWSPNKHSDAVVALYGEQGIGDECMYASMIPAAIKAAEENGSRIVIECYHRNEELFRRSFPQATVYGTLRDDYSEWPADERITHKLEMGGLGEFFGAEPFRRGPYLQPDEPRVEAMRHWLNASLAKPWRVGIAWTGGSWETGRARRSVPFELMLQLMRGQDVTFVTLEYEDRRRDLEEAPVKVLNPHWATRKGADMDDLAAVLVNLDLVISVQTSVVDYCGALGVPCWALADANPQWRYTGFFGDDSMGFYDSVKVYRQREWGAWAPVIQRVARDLKKLTGADAAAVVAE